MSAFPLPPGFTMKKRYVWVYYDRHGRRVSWARKDTREVRLMVWERYVWGYALVNP